MKTRIQSFTITIVVLLLICVGCSESVDKKTLISIPDTLKDQISQSMKDFNNRPIHKELTSEIIDTTPDDRLLQTIFDNLSEKIIDYEKEYETVLTFSKPRQAIYTIWVLEGEVSNGGFNQFYFNSSGQFADLTPEALKLIGANKFSDLVSKANSIYKKENEKIVKHQDGTLEGFSKSYEGNPLNNLDTEFYDLYKTEDLYKLQVNFIRSHKINFIDK